VKILDSDHCVALLRGHLERDGQRLSDLDLQIASIAMEIGAPLVTHHIKHYARLADIGPLKLEDWLQP
jgi:predicted nucleic acid-binding protein